ncbi:MAG TPA: phenylacetate--CoA ligase family protein [Phycisphaerae bacterium]|nr:phenylacetate--CoA ligase family protein [Phycisphaerae bacterium]
MSGWGEHLFWEEERWRELQARRAAAHLRQAAKSGLYAGRGLEGVGQIAARELESVWGQLPLTSKDELSAAGRNAWAVRAEDVREWVCTSGTTGRPLDVPMTAGDLERLAENEAAALSLAGLRAGDLCVLAVGMDRMFVAGLAYHRGAQKIGAASVRAGAIVAAQGGMLREIVGRVGGRGQRVFVIAVPSFLTGVERPDGGVEAVIAIGEPVRNEDGSANVLARRVGERLGCAVFSTYALTETCTTFAEGPGCVGGHVNPALGVVEIVDPESGRAMEEGAVGEVVVTPLGVEGMPLVRFRTGDMAWLRGGRCACGRTTPRVGPIVGRRQQLLKIRGTSVYPAAILEAVRGTAGVADCCIIAESEHALSDRVTVAVAVVEGKGEGVRGELSGRLRALLRVAPEVRVVGAGELQELQLAGGRKVQRFVDRRHGM